MLGNGLRPCSVDVALLHLLWLKPHTVWRSSWQCAALRRNVLGVCSVHSCGGDLVVQARAALTARYPSRLAGWPCCHDWLGPPAPSWPCWRGPPFVAPSSVQQCLGVMLLAPETSARLRCCNQQVVWATTTQRTLLSTHCVRKTLACCINPQLCSTPEQERLQHLHMVTRLQPVLVYPDGCGAGVVRCCCLVRYCLCTTVTSVHCAMMLLVNSQACHALACMCRRKHGVLTQTTPAQAGATSI